MRVLVTGSAGAVGKAVVKELLARGHAVRGLDRAADPQLTDHVVGDVADPAAVRRAVEGRQAVIHLAANPHGGDFLTDLLPNNVLATWHVLDAARLAGARRVVLASTVQVVIGHPHWDKTTVRIEDGPAPPNDYAMTKAMNEVMGQNFALQHGMSVFAARIAWLVRNDRERDSMIRSHREHLYVSQCDIGRFFALTLEAPDPPGRFAVLFAYGPGANGKLLYDNEPARRLIGYEPRDVFPDGLEY